MRPVSRLVLLLISGCTLLWFGIVPAWTRIDTDFPNYYTSARLVVEGRDVSMLYDTAWFQTQIYRQGIDRLGIFAPLPPVTALIMVPIALLRPLPALRAWTVVNVILLFSNIVLLSRCTRRDWPYCALLFLGSGIALINDFRFGQCYLLVTLLIMAGYLLQRNSYAGGSGIAFGSAAALKYFPLAFLPMLALRKEWKLFFSLILTMAAIYAVSVSILGTEVHRRFLTLLPGHLEGNILNPYGAGLQSLNSLLRRFFVFDALWNPSPIVDWQSGYFLAKYSLYLLVLLLTIRGYRGAAMAFGAGALPVQFALFNVAALLLLPASATYHFLLLVFPVALLLGAGSSPWRTEQKILVALFILISWIPYRLFRPFDGRGIMTFAAYPRLGLMIAIFVTVIAFIGNSGGRIIQRAPER